jgi:hypothetical protein
MRDRLDDDVDSGLIHSFVLANQTDSNS